MIELKKKELEKIQNILPVGSTIIEITESNKETAHQKRRRIARVVYSFNNEKCCSHLNYALTGQGYS